MRRRRLNAAASRYYRSRFVSKASHHAFINSNGTVAQTLTANLNQLITINNNFGSFCFGPSLLISLLNNTLKCQPHHIGLYNFVILGLVFLWRGYLGILVIALGSIGI